MGSIFSKNEDNCTRINCTIIVKPNETICLFVLMLLGLPQRRQWQPTPVLLPGKSHGRRSLVGCSPWGREESDMTPFTFHFHALEKEMATLQCSCLENPRDRGAWWAAVCGVAQSRTRLKRLSSSSRASQVVIVVQNLPAQIGDIRDTASIPESRRSLGEGHGNPHHYSCLENPMDRGAGGATVHRVEKSRTRLKRLSRHAGRSLLLFFYDC